MARSAARSLADERRQRVHDDRLSGAGLAGEDVEMRAEAYVQLVDNGKVGDGELV
jgi:hypothetical protein